MNVTFSLLFSLSFACSRSTYHRQPDKCVNLYVSFCSCGNFRECLFWNWDISGNKKASDNSMSECSCCREREEKTTQHSIRSNVIGYFRWKFSHTLCSGFSIFASTYANKMQTDKMLFSCHFSFNTQKYFYMYVAAHIPRQHRIEIGCDDDMVFLSLIFSMLLFCIN